MSRRHPYTPTPELLQLSRRLERIIVEDWDALSTSQQADVCRCLLRVSYLLSGLSSEATAEGGPGGASAAPSGG